MRPHNDLLEATREPETIGEKLAAFVLVAALAVTCICVMFMWATR